MSQNHAFISFDDAMQMRERHHYGVSTLIDIFMVDDVEIKDDFSIDCSVFGEEFSDWSGSVSKNSILFSEDFFPFSNTGSVIVDFVNHNSNYRLSIIFEQRMHIGSNFVAVDIIAHTAAANVRYWDKFTKDDIASAMRHCNNMIVG